MASVAQAQSTSNEEQVRTAIEQAMIAQGGTPVTSEVGTLVMDLGGSVKAAYLAGGFRNKMKMPMRLTVRTTGGDGGTGVAIEVTSRGTGSGVMSGGWLGAMKQGKAEKAWLELAVEAIPARVGAPAQS